MRVLVACEESQAVTKELRRLGHEAYSCDIEPCSGGHPEWHLQQDVTQLLKIRWIWLSLSLHVPIWLYPGQGILNRKERMDASRKVLSFL